MDVISDIEILESDVKDCDEKCKKVNCVAIYDAIVASFKLLYDLIFVCVSKKKTERWQLYYLEFCYHYLVILYLVNFYQYNLQYIYNQVI